MPTLNDNINMIDVTQENVADIGIYCIKDKKSPGFKAKVEWFRTKLNKGLKIKMAINNKGEQVGFIEYIPSELAWRPVKADNYFFIQCIAIFPKDEKDKGIGTFLIQQCEQNAKDNNKSGICAMSSEGPWMANKSLYEKNNFIVTDRLDRFELMVKLFDDKNAKPVFINWKKQQSKYKGWNLVYSDQCPWHEKSITDILQSAVQNKIELKVKKLTTPEEAQNSPSGFGTFSLIKDGILLADHYVSKARFENILKEELKKQNNL